MEEQLGGSAISCEEAQAALASTHFAGWWGFRVMDVSRGCAEVLLPSRDVFLRPGGVLQGGCCMTLADVAFWVAIMTLEGADTPSVTLEMKTNFLSGARTDIVTAARIIKKGRSVVFGDATTKDLEGQLVAHHTLTYIVPRS